MSSGEIFGEYQVHLFSRIVFRPPGPSWNPPKAKVQVTPHLSHALFPFKSRRVLS